LHSLSLSLEKSITMLSLDTCNQLTFGITHYSALESAVTELTSLLLNFQPSNSADGPVTPQLTALSRNNSQRFFRIYTPIQKLQFCHVINSPVTHQWTGPWNINWQCCHRIDSVVTLLTGLSLCRQPRHTSTISAMKHQLTVPSQNGQCCHAVDRPPSM
jgi:hypothetical protein